MKDIRSNPYILSIMTSVIGRGNSSLGHALSDHENQCKLGSPILLGDGDDISHPIRVLFFPDETRIYKLLDFRLDLFHYLWAEPSLLLLDGPHVRIDVKAMHSHLGVKPGHIFIVSGENIYIFSHERY